MNISGPIESITIGNRRFAVNGDDAGNITLQGKKNEVKFNGDGSKRLIRSLASGSIKGLNVQITHGNKDLEFLRDLQAKSDFFDVSITHCDGTVYSGSMQFVDDITEDTQQGTAGISLEGDLDRQ
ncbi:MAG: hypothetical protein LBC99_06605 [Spirochaetota bacterium]|jgi:hypothetical protein|nr:hypothetical protein [Spirochaetota bacterium]